VLDWAENMEKDKKQLEIFLNLLIELYRDKIIQLNKGQARLKEETSIIFPEKYGLDTCLSSLDEINRIPYYQKYNVNLRLILEVLLLNLRNIELKERGHNPIG
jgi:hypothetical protein